MHGGYGFGFVHVITPIADSKTSEHLDCLQTYRGSHQFAHNDMNSISTFPLANIYLPNTEPCGFSNMPAKSRWLVLQRGKGMKMCGSKLKPLQQPPAMP